ncbi:YveK family protein [uncultured Holdemanella sp.]|uniref:YveK family protein n=1 Tax=uncultured Holdemanella sp. TaxID=1763549 RepID=UPI00258D77D7|nr:hypothetical protein [uncultured Holdemanella sp.]
MKDEYLNEEAEVDLIELIKYLLTQLKNILKTMCICGIFTFSVTCFILPKSYVSSMDVTLLSSGELIDFSPYIVSTSVLKSVSKSIDVDINTLSNSISVIRDSNDINNYHISATTNNSELSYKIVNSLLKEFQTKMSNDLKLNRVLMLNPAQVNNIPVSPNVEKSTFLAIIFGFIIHTFLVMLSYLCDNHLRNTREAESFLGVEVLSEIPWEK